MDGDTSLNYLVSVALNFQKESFSFNQFTKH